MAARRKKDKSPVFLTSWDKVPLMVDTGYLMALFRISRETARKMCVSGALPAVKLNDQWYVNKKDLMTICGERVE